MRCSNNFKRLLLFMIVLPFCSSSNDTLGGRVSKITYPGGPRPNTLVSAGERFELGFFSPNRISNSRRYVGIWCYRSDPLIVVWVANRSAPIVGRTASFGLLNGDLQLWNDGQLIWSTDATSSSSSTRFAELLDTGNLVLKEDHGSKILWESFNDSTNTFLPGMRMTDDFKLTSWASQDNPKEGEFMFQRVQGGDTSDYGVFRGVTPYWKSGVYGNFIRPDPMFQVISSLLSNSTTANHSSPENYRLVMTNDGQIQYFKQVNESKPFWFQPASRCSEFNKCHKFQSCNDENGDKTRCKCLPGFELRSEECLRKSQMFERTSDFLSLKMMKTGNPDSQFPVNSKEQCKQKCIDDRKCQAYSYSFEEHQRRGSGNLICYTWSKDLDNMQELAQDGHSLYVRVPLSDIGCTSRSCGTCGTNLVPYPLSTRQNCGDPLYSAFHCNSTTDHLYFKWYKSDYRVTNINPEDRTFTIQVNSTNCTSGGLMEINQQPNQTLPFSVSSRCEDFSTGLSEVKIEWIAPKEPLCNTIKDCTWPNATCRDASGGMTTRCLCDSGFTWNYFSVNCSLVVNNYSEGGGSSQRSQKVKPVYIVAPAVAAIFILVFGGLFYMRRRLGSTQGSRESTQENLNFRLHDSETDQNVDGLMPVRRGR